MDKQIPIYFDSVTISSPIEQISESNPNLGRLKVRVFTKFGNRNGSYITEAVADQIIQSATNGMTPVIGFFDPSSQSWASHTGPKLANGYGYVESFLGWEPFVDTDGVTRDYAVFSVILFTKYFEEARKILGENQSMELNPETIEGDWAMIEGQEYFVYTKAETLGLCVIGQHEPCFSVSAFFSKNDDQYKTQYEKFSSLLSDLKTQVEEAEKFEKGGEQQMDMLNDQVVEEVTPSVEDEVKQDGEFQAAEETVVEEESVAEVVEEDVVVEEPAAEPAEETTDFEALYNELQVTHQELQQNYENAQARIAELEEINNTVTENYEALQVTNNELQASIQKYEAQAAAELEVKKNTLVDRYSHVLDAEQIEDARAHMANFSYEELESKLAISFANKQISGSKVDMVPLQEPEETTFASIMKNYKK